MRKEMYFGGAGIIITPTPVASKRDKIILTEYAREISDIFFAFRENFGEKANNPEFYNKLADYVLECLKRGYDKEILLLRIYTKALSLIID